MPRSLILGFLLLASAGASAALPLAPETRLRPMEGVQTHPAAATNGTTTLVVWRNAHRIFARLLGVHEAAVDLGVGIGLLGNESQAAWNGHEYLIVHTGAAIVMNGDGSLGARREIQSTNVTSLLWDGARWIVGTLRRDDGFVLILDRELNVERTIELGPARRVGLTTIGGRAWVVHQRAADTEVFPIGVETTRFRVGGHARMVGRIAIIEESLFLSILDPQSGFPQPAPFMASFEVPLELVHAAPFGGGALFAIYAPAFQSVLLVTVDAHGFRQEYSAGFYGLPYRPQVAVAGTTLVIAAHPHVYAFPLQPWPREAFALTGDAVVSIGAAQREPLVVSNGSSALAFWNQHDASFVRPIDENGIPFGPVTQLPFLLPHNAQAAFHGDRYVLVWESGFGPLLASAGGAPVQLDDWGGSLRVARGPHGSFAVWRNFEGSVVGTPLREDATPVVPGGIVISSAPIPGDAGLNITVAPEGFAVSFTDQLVLLAPDGTMRSATTIGMRPYRIGGSLIAGPDVLGVIGGETIPWHPGWATVGIHPMDGGRHLVVLGRGTETRASVVTVADGRIVNATEPRLLFDRFPGSSSIAVVGSTPIVVYSLERQVWVATVPAKRRAVRR